MTDSAGFSVREGGPADLPFLRAMLYEALTWRAGIAHPSPEELLGDPKLARYLDGWGRAGDRAMVAVDGDGLSIGAAWFRLFEADEPGFGFVAEDIPELSVAVADGWRGRGVGGALLEALIRAAGPSGFGALSLSVEPDNPALRLYRRLGFREVGGDEGARTMVLELSVL